jgi:hypothetical protein
MATTDKSDAGIAWLSVNASHSHSSAALPLLHRACEMRGLPLEWHEVHCPPGADPSRAIGRLGELRPRFIAASCYLFNVNAVLRLCRRAKALLPDATILLGGPEHLGSHDRLLTAESAVAVVVRGEGEAVFPEILRRLLGGECLSGLPGVSFRRRDQAPFLSPPEERAPELPWDQLPDPTESPFHRTDGPFVQVETSRGCRGTCTYCTSGGAKPRRAPLQTVRHRLDRLAHQGCTEVRLLDRTFNDDPGRGRELLDMFRNSFAHLRFHLEIHPGKLPGELREALALAPAGQLHLEVGIQSGDATVRANCSRGGSAERDWEGAEYLCGRTNLATHIDLLAGLPGQTPDSLVADILRTVAMQPDEIQLETVKLLPGTKLRSMAPDIGLAHAPDPPYEILATPTMDATGMWTATRLSQLLDRFHNPVQLRTAFRQAVADCGQSFLFGFLDRLAAHSPAGQPLSLGNRFRLLHAYAGDRGMRSTVAAVRYAWLRWGFSPQHGLCPAEPFPQAPPANAVLLEGQRRNCPTRTWKASVGDGQYLFLFHRHRTRQPAYAVLRTD